MESTGWASDLWGDIKREVGATLEDAYKSILRRAEVNVSAGGGSDPAFSLRIGEENNRKLLIAAAAGAALVWLLTRSR